MPNLLVSGVILGFLLSLYILGSVIISSHLTKKPTAEEVAKNKVISKMGLVIIPISFGIVLSIFSVNLLTGAPLKQEMTFQIGLLLLLRFGLVFQLHS